MAKRSEAERVRSAYRESSRSYVYIRLGFAAGTFPQGILLAAWGLDFAFKHHVLSVPLPSRFSGKLALQITANQTCCLYVKTHANHCKSWFADCKSDCQSMRCLLRFANQVHDMICSLICSLQIMTCSLQIIPKLPLNPSQIDVWLTLHPMCS